MLNQHKLPYLLISFGVFILLKFGYTAADTRDLGFLLRPTDNIISLITSSSSIYLDSGYYHPKLNIVIDKSCSGFNFLLICFLMLNFLLLQYTKRVLDNILVVPISLIFAYLFTILVNSSRIFVSLIMQSQTNISAMPGQHIIHDAIGVVTNLLFLVIIYFFVEKFLNKTNYAKFIKS